MNMREDFNTLQKPVNIKASASLIGESVSEPHTSEFIGRISLIYYIYVSHIVRPMHAYACRMQEMCMWSNNMCTRMFFC